MKGVIEEALDKGKHPLEDALVALFESTIQADHDLVGEQRKWHLPRLRRAMTNLMQVFPRESASALLRVYDPYGKRVCED